MTVRVTVAGTSSERSGYAAHGHCNLTKLNSRNTAPRRVQRGYMDTTPVDGNELSARERDDVRKTLRTLIAPMVLSLLLHGSIQVVDTMYLSLIGDRALAAFSFMQPVIVGVTQLCMGFGIGITSVISRALGEGNRTVVARLVAHTLVLALLGAALITTTLLAIQPFLFRGLGASEIEAPLIHGFMLRWIPAIVFVMVITWGTAVLRSLGETRSTALVMLTQSVVNLALAPVLMFGVAGNPAMGMNGAGLALMLATASGAVLTVWFLLRRSELPFALSARRWVGSATATLAVALPAVFTYVLVPISTAIFTRWLAAFGSQAVAAFGVVVRFEIFITTVPLAIGAGLGPFVGRQWGAGQTAKIRYATAWCLRRAQLWGLTSTLVLAAFAVPMGRMVADDLAFAAKVATAFWIIPLGFASYASIVVASSVYNSIGRATRTMSFALLRTLAIAVPVGAIGQRVFGFQGLYGALPIASLITGWYAVRQLRIDDLRAVATEKFTPSMAKAK
jgi:Na+-driven multidrug efflux pump